MIWDTRKWLAEPGVVKRSVLVAWLVMLVAGCGIRKDDAAGPAPGDSTTVVAPGSTAGPADSSSAEAAAAVVRAYYDAIGTRDYERAYLCWGQEGAASGKTYAAFAAGFENTASVSVDVGAPGPIEAAAGSRYIDIPVQVLAHTRNGELQHFAGSYVLRRSEVDGATSAQRHWHLYTASMRER